MKTATRFWLRLLMNIAGICSANLVTAVHRTDYYEASYRYTWSTGRLVACIGSKAKQEDAGWMISPVSAAIICIS